MKIFSNASTAEVPAAQTRKGASRLRKAQLPNAYAEQPSLEIENAAISDYNLALRPCGEALRVENYGVCNTIQLDPEFEDERCAKRIRVFFH
jgi:hypothetical protein